MPTEFNELAQQIIQPSAILLAGVLAGMALERLLSRKRRQAWRERNRLRWARERNGGDILSGLWPAPKPVSAPPKPTDPADQLRIVMGAEFTVWPAAGFVDTEIRCLTQLESWNAETEVQPRVQA